MLTTPILSRTLELNATKCLSQNVRELVFSTNVLNVNTLPKMEACLDMLAPIMEDRVFEQLNCGLVVHKDCRDIILLAEEVAKKPAKPNSLASRCRGGNVLCLAR
jgi:hypothetical protein